MVLSTFLTLKICVAEIHLESSAVCGQSVISEGTVRQWCRMFEDGRTDVYDEEQSFQPSVESHDLVQSVDLNICERQCFTISELPCEFP
jgi:hypothetical protein